jgi:flagellar motor switch/type III secretory pathway protein FliN
MSTVTEVVTAALQQQPAKDPWADVMWLPCSVTVEIAIPHFTVGDLLRIGAGTVLETLWNQGTEVPLTINGHKVADAHFEAIGRKLAVRIAEV